MNTYQTKRLPNTRVDVADALRGIAVAGIILFHSVEHFNVFTQEAITHTLSFDKTVYDVMSWLLSGKMYGIFAMLFGLSFFIMNDNQQQKGKSFSGRFAWRMCLLLVFGLVNTAFYDGDILVTYAILGMFLIPCSYLPSKAVWCIVGLLAIQPIELFSLLTGWEMNTDTLWATFGKMGEVHQHGGFLDCVAINLHYGFYADVLYFIYTGRLTQILALFILGMLLGRHRFFYDEGRHLHYWRIIFGIAVSLVVAGSIVKFGTLDKLLNPIYNLCILMMIVSGVVLIWYASRGARGTLEHLCVYGRMSLTNYLIQSVVGSFVFCGYGLACYRHIGTAYALLVGVVMVGAQYVFCRCWFRSHSRGPLEGLWRKLTWIRKS